MYNFVSIVQTYITEQPSIQQTHPPTSDSSRPNYQESDIPGKFQGSFEAWGPEGLRTATEGT